MSATEIKKLNSPGPLVIPAQIKTITAVLMFLGLAGFLFSLSSDQHRAWYAYLVPLFYFVSLSLGGLFFTCLQHVTSAGWSVTIRRLCESLTAFLPFAAVAMIVFMVFGAKHLYEWLNAAEVAKDEMLQHKAGYLNQTFFWVRSILFFGIWLYFSKVLVGRSTEQDKTGDPQLTIKSVKTAIGFILLFALSYSFFSIDLLMSLEPHWFSTIYGVYCFSGLFQATMAVVIIMAIMMKNQLKGFVTEEHIHDLAKFLFAFTVFWAYIAFSQYMLMWYANLPEETTFFLPRSEGPWVLVSLALLIFRFIVPFFALLPRWAKRSSSHLVVISVLILVMEYVDLFWLTYPSMNEHEIVFGIPEVSAFLLFLGSFIFMVSNFLSRHSVVAIRDPRLDEALHHHVVY